MCRSPPRPHIHLVGGHVVVSDSHGDEYRDQDEDIHQIFCGQQALRAVESRRVPADRSATSAYTAR
jgi:hypothetical protein